MFILKILKLCEKGELPITTMIKKGLPMPTIHNQTEFMDTGTQLTFKKIFLHVFQINFQVLKSTNSFVYLYHKIEFKEKKY